MSNQRRVSLTVMDPITSINPDKDTTFAFLLELQARGVENLVCELHDLSAHGPRGRARARAVTVRRPTSDDPRHVTLGAERDVWFDDLDVIWMRKDPPVDSLFLYALMILDRHDPKRTLVLNNPANLRVVHEKLWGIYADDVTPKTLVTSRRDLILEFFAQERRAVLKPLHAMGGLGVFVFNHDDMNLKSAVDMLTEEGRRPAVVQEYVPAVREGDKRLILVDGEPLGALLRVPRGDDHRANLHVGGSAKAGVIDDHDRRIAARYGPALVDLGMFFVGLDIIGGKVTEVNVTSPTGVQEIDRLDGRSGEDRVAAQVISRALRKLEHLAAAR